MRRFYDTKKSLKRKQLERDALEQLRKTRSDIDPALLELIKTITKNVNPEDIITAQKQPPEHDQVPIDRAKNLETISLFIQNTADRPGLRAKLLDLLKAKD